MAANKTYPCLSDEAEVLIPGGAIVAIGASRFSIGNGVLADPAWHTPPVLWSLSYVAAILDGNNLLNSKGGKFSDPVAEDLK